MAFLDASGKILEINDSLCHFLGRSRDDLVGINISEISHPEDMWTDRRELGRLLRGETDSYHIEKRFIHHGGSAIWGQVSVGAIRDDAGAVAMLLIQVQDIDRCRKALADLEAIRHRLEQATSSGDIGIWEIARADRKLFLNEIARNICGFSDGTKPTTEMFSSLVHHDDAPLWLAALEGALNEGSGFEKIEFRIVTAEGETRFVRLSGRAVRGDNGRISGAVGTVLDITPQKRASSELVRALEMAESAATAKTNFLARMSHEIRTPMNAILAPAQLLSDTKLDNSQRDLVAMMASAGDHLLHVINTILDFSKLEAGKMTLAAQPFDVATLVADTLAPYEIVANGKEITLAHNVAPEAMGIWTGDAQRIRQVLINLVSNAIKFTSCGEVSVRVSMWQSEGDASGIEFEVRDSGPGIALDETDRIFLPFEQSPVEKNSRPGGTGLGLAICRELVDLMGGILGVDSTPGEGSQFWFRIPLRRSELNEAAPAPPPPREVPAMAGVWESSPNILIVEDNPSNRKVISLLLKKLGCSVSFASDGNQALEALSLSDFDLVLMDCEMPRMDGYECATRIRELEFPRGRRPPVVALSAHVGAEHTDRCLRSGMDAVLAKPVSRVELHGILEKFLRTKS